MTMKMCLLKLVAVCCFLSPAAAQLPSSMRALVAKLPYVGSNFSALSLSDVKLPKVGKKQVLIQVNTTSINPCDTDIVKGPKAEYDALALIHKTLGFDFSGTVVQVGSECSRLKVGDEVWGDLGELGLTKGVAQMGAFAQYAAADESEVGIKPAALSFAEAGVAPLVGITNYQSFVKAGAPWDLSKNVSVLVTSGQGGTGHLAVQMAKAMGAGWVVSTADTEHVEWVRGLGADVVYDYTAGDVFSQLADDSMDVVYDNYGAAGNSDKAQRVLRSGGTLVMIQGFKKPAHPKAGVKSYNVLCRIDGHAELDQMASWAAQGKLKVSVQEQIPFEAIGRAYETNAAGHVTGKLAVVM
eukprot:g6832.t1